MNLKRPASKQPIPKHAKRVFSGIIFDIYQWEQRMFDGSTTTFEKAKKKSDSVNVLPITKEGKIILCKQKQPQERAFTGALGGRIDLKETPLRAAKRELLEESGYKAKKFILLNASQPDIKVDWVCYTFIAKSLITAKAPETDSGERIRLIEVTFDEYMKIITQDNYRDNEISLFLLKAKENSKEFNRIKKSFKP
ncbi:MAG: NUDIX hydrolase [Candidatus Dojkabacteria bacterium]|jgi:ADP-ribose pyrophosphatase YjhB (NUDIX family)|nr:NUDIX hydrolase [Candidatus Dojkabacteria bacterium]